MIGLNEQQLWFDSAISKHAEWMLPVGQQLLARQQLADANYALTLQYQQAQNSVQNAAATALAQPYVAYQPLQTAPTATATVPFFGEFQLLQNFYNSAQLNSFSQEQ